MYDIAIVGGGCIGALTARELARYRLKTVVLEAASDVAAGASRANSGIVHAGFDAAEGSLKAKFNVLGNEMMETVCKELGVEYKNNASLVLAFDEEQEKTLKELVERGKKNGVKGLKILNKEEVLRREPNVSKEVFAALYALLRFILEFWREPDAQLGLLGPLQLTMGQYLCALQFAAALTIFLYLYRKGRPAA